ncbi:olfactory receptor 11A1-like [Pelodytes ibericus]
MMNEQNQTVITEFFLLGFQNLHSFKIPFFLLILTIYIMTVGGNFFIVLLVLTSPILQSPMYFFLSHLSLCDAILTTNIAPNMLHAILEEGTVISMFGCLTQFEIFGCCGTTECYILTAMSYDRYLAICKPLHYSSIMGFRFRLNLISWSWFLGFLFSLITRVLVGGLQFCNHHVIDHFFCDLLPILELSCSDTSAVDLEKLVVTPFILLLPFGFVVFTYIHIFFIIFRISSTTGRQKTFSTCSSHLTVVCLYYGTLISIYVSPSRGFLLNINKFTSLFYTMVTPLFNPAIYSLRNQEIRKAFNIFFTECLQHILN